MLMVVTSTRHKPARMTRPPPGPGPNSSVPSRNCYVMLRAVAASRNAHPCHAARSRGIRKCPSPSCCAQSQHPEMPVKHSKPKVPGFRDYARNDSVETTAPCGASPSCCAQSQHPEMPIPVMLRAVAASRNANSLSGADLLALTPARCPGWPTPRLAFPCSLERFWRQCAAPHGGCKGGPGGPLAMSGSETRQARKGATVAAAACAGVWLSGPLPGLKRIRYVLSGAGAKMAPGHI